MGADNDLSAQEKMGAVTSLDVCRALRTGAGGKVMDYVATDLYILVGRPSSNQSVRGWVAAGVQRACGSWE